MGDLVQVANNVKVKYSWDIVCCSRERTESNNCESKLIEYFKILEGEEEKGRNRRTTWEKVMAKVTEKRRDQRWKKRRMDREKEEVVVERADQEKEGDWIGCLSAQVSFCPECISIFMCRVITLHCLVHWDKFVYVRTDVDIDLGNDQAILPCY